MTEDGAYQTLEHRYKKLAVLGGVHRMLHWDSQTMMPAGGAGDRRLAARVRQLREGHRRDDQRQFVAAAEQLDGGVAFADVDEHARQQRDALEGRAVGAQGQLVVRAAREVVVGELRQALGGQPFVVEEVQRVGALANSAALEQCNALGSLPRFPGHLA